MTTEGMTLEQVGVDDLPYAYDDDHPAYGGDGNDGHFHAVPLNDLYPHKMHRNCWCRPTRDEEREDLWQHEAADRRGRYMTQ